MADAQCADATATGSLNRTPSEDQIDNAGEQLLAEMNKQNESNAAFDNLRPESLHSPLSPDVSAEEEVQLLSMEHDECEEMSQGVPSRSTIFETSEAADILDNLSLTNTDKDKDLMPPPKNVSVASSVLEPIRYSSIPLIDNIIRIVWMT